MPHSITDGITEESSAGQMTHIAGGSYGHYFYETKARREWITFGCGLAASLCVCFWFSQSDSSDRLFFAFLTYYVTQLKVRNLRKAKAFPMFPTSD